MKISYKFVTGEAVEIEVEDAIGESVAELESRSYKLDRKETRRHKSYSDDNGKRDIIVDESVDVEGDALRRVENAKLMNALEKLLPKQRELVRKVFFEGVSETEIACEMGVSQQAISKQLKAIYIKLKKFIN